MSESDNISTLERLKLYTEAALERVFTCPITEPTAFLPSVLASFASGTLENIPSETLGRTLNALSVQEQYYRISRSGHQFIPTIGLEWEIPEQRIRDNLLIALDRLGLENHAEKNGSHKFKYHELNTPYSYSAWSQDTIIRSLFSLGITAVNFDGDVAADIDNSLHINLGNTLNIPLELADHYSRHMFMLSDLVTYAFVSPRRLLRRKTNCSVAARSENTKPSERNIDPDNVFRIELRTPEVRSGSVYTMLDNTQMLGSAYFAYLGVCGHLAGGDTVKQLSGSWLLAWNHYIDLKKRYNLMSDHFEDDPDYIAHLLETTDLRETANRIVYNTVQNVENILADVT